jgi:hypothetical protein
MPDYRTAFPGKFLSAADIERPFEVTVASVDLDDVGTDQSPSRKLVARFVEDGSRPIVLNRSRAEILETLAGTADYTAWRGTRVRVSQGTTRYAGKKVACIEFSEPATPF